MPRILSAETTTQDVAEDKRTRFRRRLKRLTLLVVLIVVAAHLLVGAVASVFVIAHYFAKPRVEFTATKEVELKPEEREHRVAMAQVEAMRPAPTLNNRIQSLKPSALVLPDLPKVPIEADVPIVASTVTTGQIGSVGGHAGSEGAGTKDGFFGSEGLVGNGLLEGTFYDLKQTNDGKPTDMTPDKYNAELSKFMFLKWSDGELDKFFKGPNRLFARQIYIPTINADSGPKAFNVADKVQPRMWAAIYRATVVPPVTGRVRFVGFGDDILVVRYNRKVVLDGSIFPPSGWKPKERQPVVNRAIVRTGVPGDWINVTAGEKDRIEIVFGEQPGGLFTAYLYFEYKDGNYQKDEKGNAILPLFRLAGGSLPQPGNPDQIPPFDPSGPVWNVVKTSTMTELP